MPRERPVRVAEVAVENFIALLGSCTTNRITEIDEERRVLSHDLGGAGFLGVVAGIRVLRASENFGKVFVFAGLVFWFWFAALVFWLVVASLVFGFAALWLGPVPCQFSPLAFAYGVAGVH